MLSLAPIGAACQETVVCAEQSPHTNIDHRNDPRWAQVRATTIEKFGVDCAAFCKMSRRFHRTGQHRSAVLALHECMVDESKNNSDRHAQLGLYYNLLSDTLKTEHHLLRSLELAPRNSTEWGKAKLYLAWNYRRREDYIAGQAQLSDLRTAMDSDPLLYKIYSGYVDQVAGELDLYFDRFAQARVFLQRAADKLTADPTLWFINKALRARAFQGEWGPSPMAVNDLQEMSTNSSMPPLARWVVMEELVHARLFLGDLPRATRTLQKYTDMVAETSDWDVMRGGGRVMLSRLYEAKGDTVAAINAAGDAIREFRRLGYISGLAQAYFRLGQAEIVANQTTAARRSLLEAARLFGRMNARGRVLSSYVALADHFSGRGADGEACQWINAARPYRAFTISPRRRAAFDKYQGTCTAAGASIPETDHRYATPETDHSHTTAANAPPTTQTRPTQQTPSRTKDQLVQGAVLALRSATNLTISPTFSANVVDWNRPALFRWRVTNQGDGAIAISLRTSASFYTTGPSNEYGSVIFDIDLAKDGGGLPYRTLLPPFGEAIIWARVRPSGKPTTSLLSISVTATDERAATATFDSRFVAPGNSPKLGINGVEHQSTIRGVEFLHEARQESDAQSLEIVSVASTALYIEIHTAVTAKILAIDTNGDGDFADVGDSVFHDANGDGRLDLPKNESHFVIVAYPSQDDLRRRGQIEIATSLYLAGMPAGGQTDVLLLDGTSAMPGE